MELENGKPSDQWLLKPRASDEMEITAHSFKAFGRIFIWTISRDFEKVDVYEIDDENSENVAQL